MAQPLSIENEEWVYLITTRTALSRLWFVNNPELEQLILGMLARYQEIYGVVIYAFVIMGNHYHLLAKFPNKNRALFMRDFNSAVARLVGRYVAAHGRRSVWARRYAYQVILNPEDIKHWFFYVSLNPVSSGIVKSVKEYPSYNSFFDAVSGQSRTYRWTDWSNFLMKVRYDPSLKPGDFSKEYKLVFSPLPEVESVSYQAEMTKELLERQEILVQERKAANKGFLGLAKLKAQDQGAFPRTTKKSGRYSIRPLILTLCRNTKQEFLALYFSIYSQFKEASGAFRAGNLLVPFPSGTYPPPRMVVA